MEKRIAIVFLDVIREIYKMRGGKVVNSNINLIYEKYKSVLAYRSLDKFNKQVQNIGLGIRIAIITNDIDYLNSLLYGFDVRDNRNHFLILPVDDIVVDIVLICDDLAVCEIRDRDVA